MRSAELGLRYRRALSTLLTVRNAGVVAWSHRPSRRGRESGRICEVQDVSRRRTARATLITPPGVLEG